MNLLLDTHILIWCLDNSPKIRKDTYEAILDSNNVVAVSSVSIWEIRIKQQLNRLDDVPIDFYERLISLPYELLSISPIHANAISDLPMIHKDPFDRMLIAQAQIENLTLVTRDPKILKYDIDTLIA